MHNNSINHNTEETHEGWTVWREWPHGPGTY